MSNTPLRVAVATHLILFAAAMACALEPDQILVVANNDVPESVELARYYCEKRLVPADNILALPLGKDLGDTISRADYEKKLADPIREKLSAASAAGKIRCLLTIYGVPIKVSGRGPLREYQDRLKQLKQQLEQEKTRLIQLEQGDPAGSAQEKKKTERKLRRLQTRIDYIEGKETGASVDSELSMVLFGSYELYRWHPNTLKGKTSVWDFKTLMVSRLDGPGPEIAHGLVDKALKAEKFGLWGCAYIDSRGFANDKTPYSLGYFDQSLRDLAALTRLQTKMSVKEERTAALFAPGDCPLTAIYCGWYSLKHYIDAFDFVDGAVGYHIASWEAADLRDPNSSQWCPAMLKDGITATLGSVSEPYLHSFPEPKAFFAELFDGRCLAEAYYHTNPFNSWQLVLIGDPLYRPFKRR
jgi:uncharacterized protein (TIGR03790 family)